MRNDLPTRVGLWLIAVVLMLDLAMGGLLFTVRVDQSHQDGRFQSLVICQVHHNELTNAALSKNGEATAASVRSELRLWTRLVQAIRTQNLTGRILVRSIDAHRADLRYRLRTLHAHPYPPGGLCDQLIQNTR